VPRRSSEAPWDGASFGDGRRESVGFGRHDCKAHSNTSWLWHYWQIAFRAPFEIWIWEYQRLFGDGSPFLMCSEMSLSWKGPIARRTMMSCSRWQWQPAGFAQCVQCSLSWAFSIPSKPRGLGEIERYRHRRFALPMGYESRVQCIRGPRHPKSIHEPRHRA